MSDLVPGEPGDDALYLDPEPEPAEDATDRLIIEALATGATQAEAAGLAGVSERTVRRRMADDAFAREVSVRRGDRVSELTGKLVEASFEAVRTLEAGLTAERDSDRLRAAHQLLLLVVRYRSEGELERRLTAVERALEHEADEAGSGTPEPAP